MSNDMSEDSHSVDQEINPPLGMLTGWTFKKNSEESVISNQWCTPLPLIPSPTTTMALVLTHLKSPRTRAIEQGTMSSLMEQISYTTGQINIITEREEAMMENYVRDPEDRPVQVTARIIDELSYFVQFPANIQGAKSIILEDYKAKWMIEYSGNMQEGQGEYLHSLLLKGGFLADGGNLNAMAEREAIVQVVEAQRKDTHTINREGRTVTNFPLSLLVWNCGGKSATVGFRNNMKSVLCMHRPNVVAVTETRLSGSRAKAVCASFGYDRCFVGDPFGFAGGLWVMWHSDSVALDLIAVSQKEVHASIEYVAK